jgi:hypothetical protein
VADGGGDDGEHRRRPQPRRHDAPPGAAQRPVRLRPARPPPPAGDGGPGGRRGSAGRRCASCRRRGPSRAASTPRWSAGRAPAHRRDGRARLSRSSTRPRPSSASARRRRGSQERRRQQPLPARGGVDGEALVVFSALDNLVKGAAGGAVQWMNRLLGLPERHGASGPGCSGLKAEARAGCRDGNDAADGRGGPCCRSTTSCRSRRSAATASGSKTPRRPPSARPLGRPRRGPARPRPPAAARGALASRRRRSCSRATPAAAAARGAPRRLAAFAPPGLDHVFFVNSGAEANENALKLAFRHTGRSRVVAVEGAFHGRTAAAGGGQLGCGGALVRLPATPLRRHLRARAATSTPSLRRARLRRRRGAHPRAGAGRGRGGRPRPRLPAAARELTRRAGAC